MWISKGIIQKYGGSISFRSLRNSGRNITCFQIFLPQADLGAADRMDDEPSGVMHLLAGSKSAQGYELQLGVRCLGPVLLAELLTPLGLRPTAPSPVSLTPC